MTSMKHTGQREVHVAIYHGRPQHLQYDRYVGSFGSAKETHHDGVQSFRLHGSAIAGHGLDQIASPEATGPSSPDRFAGERRQAGESCANTSPQRKEVLITAVSRLAPRSPLPTHINLGTLEAVRVERRLREKRKGERVPNSGTPQLSLSETGRHGIWVRPAPRKTRGITENVGEREVTFWR